MRGDIISGSWNQCQSILQSFYPINGITNISDDALHGLFKDSMHQKYMLELSSKGIIVITYQIDLNWWNMRHGDAVNIQICWLKKMTHELIKPLKLPEIYLSLRWHYAQVPINFSQEFGKVCSAPPQGNTLNHRKTHIHPICIWFPFKSMNMYLAIIQQRKKLQLLERTGLENT